MLANIFKDRCQRQTMSSTHSALGDTLTWGQSVTYYCRKRPVDVKTRLAYMQKNTDITDEFIFRGNVDFRLGVHRILYKGYIYELAETAMHLEGKTIVLTKRQLEAVV